MLLFLKSVSQRYIIVKEIRRYEEARKREHIQKLTE